MGQVTIPHYPFDFHTHLWGILPTVGPLSLQTVAAKEMHAQDPESIVGELSIVRYMFAKCLVQAQGKMAKWFPKAGWFSGKSGASRNDTFDIKWYERGECTVESAMVAYNLLFDTKAKDHGFGFETQDALMAQLLELEKGLDVNTDELTEELGTASRWDQAYARALELVELAIAHSPRAQLNEAILDACLATLTQRQISFIVNLEALNSVYQFYSYFCDKMMSANEYMPFDDAYLARDTLKKESGQEFVEVTKAYLSATGTTHLQISAGRPKDAAGEAKFRTLLGANLGNIKLLSHNVSHNKVSDINKLRKFFAQAVEDFNETEGWQTNMIGIDFLGSERQIDFDNLFKIANETLGTANTGADGKRKFTLRIHSGEGSGVYYNNRSIMGHLAAHVSKTAVFADKGTYIGFLNGLAQFRNDPSIQASKQPAFPEVYNLQERVYSGPYADMRFNIFSEKTHARTTAVAEANMMAVYHAATRRGPDGAYIYGADEAAFSDVCIRLGHGYHARRYLFALKDLEGLSPAFRNMQVDTNLGSNFVTGSSSGFDSPHAYANAAGLRTLTTFAPREYVMPTIDAVFGTSKASDQRPVESLPVLLGSDGEGVEHTKLQMENVRAYVLSLIYLGLRAKSQDIEGLDFHDLLSARGWNNYMGFAPESILNIAQAYWEETVGEMNVGDSPRPGPLTIDGLARICTNRLPNTTAQQAYTYVLSGEFDLHWTP